MNALQKCQWRHDNAEPDNNAAEQDHIDGQARLLLSGSSILGVPWGEFGQVASENLADADGDDHRALQIMLALRDGKFDKAHSLYLQHFDAVVCECAESCVRYAMNKAAA
jgi:hypothetical protein